MGHTVAVSAADHPVPLGRTPAPGPAPRSLRPIIVLLLVNLGLSVLLTVGVLLRHDAVIDHLLDQRGIMDPDLRETVRKAYLNSLSARVLGNMVTSVVYVFLVRALLRGRRWAYRRVILIGVFGIVALLILQLTPYPAWIRAEQAAQAVVLASLLYLVQRPEVRQHFAAHLPGRTGRLGRHR